MFELVEVVLLLGLLLVITEVKRNFFIPAGAAAYMGYMAFQIDHTDPQAYFITGMIILFGCACGYTFWISYNKNG